MKRIIAFIAVISMVFAMAIVPLHAEENGVIIKYDAEKDELRISGSGVLKREDTERYTGHNNVWWMLETVIFEGDVSEIGAGAFSGAGGLQNVIFNDKIKVIGEDAFSSCSIKELNIPDSVVEIGAGAFCYNDMKSVELHEGIKSIGAGTFENCTDLKRFVMTDNVTAIGDSAFAGCTELEDITLSKNIETIGNNVFDEVPWRKTQQLPMYIAQSLVCYHVGDEMAEGELDDVVIKDGTTKICNGALVPDRVRSVVMPDSIGELEKEFFKDYINLEKVMLPVTIKKISGSLFSGCTALKGIDIPKGAEIIENYAFSNCTVLTEVKIPDSVTSIGNYAFANCNALKNIKIPGGVKSILSNAFEKCESLSNVTISPEVELIENAFNGTPWYKNLPDTKVINGNLIKCSVNEAGEAIVPKGTKNIAPSLFANRTSVKTVYLPDGLERIGSIAFYNCKNLQKVYIPDSVKYVGAEAFYRYNTDNGRIEIGSVPKGLEYIGKDAFKNCGITGELELLGTVKYIGEGAFRNTEISSVKIHDPQGELELGGSYAGGIFEYCKNLKYARIPGVSAPNMFYECEQLSEVEMGEGVTEIKPDMFYKTALKRFNVPKTVTQIHTGAFSNCKELEAVTLPEGIKYIGSSGFSSCKKLSEINLPDSIERIDSYAFYGCSLFTDGNLPSSLKEIGSGAFEYCNQLSFVEIPETVTVIGGEAFKDTSIDAVKLPENLKKLGGYAFEATKVHELIIPESVETIGSEIANEIEGEVHIYVPSTVKNVSKGAFTGNDITVYAPRDSAAYKVAAECGAKIVETKENRIGAVYNKLIATDIVTIINSQRINSYAINGQTVLLIRDLESMGFDVSFDEAARTAYATYNPNKITVQDNAVALPDDKVIYSDITVIVNGLEVKGFNVGGYMAVVAEELGRYIPDISCTWIPKERTLEMTASEDIATIDYFIEEFARLNGWEVMGNMGYFSDAKSQYTDNAVLKNIIKTDEHKGLLYPETGLTVYLFATYAGRGIYGGGYETRAYEKDCYTVDEIDYTNISYYIRSYLTEMYEAGVFKLENINGVNTINTNRVMTKAEVTAALEKLIANSQ